MKTLRRLCTASALTLALSLPVFAGEITTMVTSPPPPPAVKADSEISTTIAGQEETGSSEATATDSATEIALNLLQTLMSLF